MVFIRSAALEVFIDRGAFESRRGMFGVRFAPSQRTKSNRPTTTPPTTSRLPRRTLRYRPTRYAVLFFTDFQLGQRVEPTDVFPRSPVDGFRAHGVAVCSGSPAIPKLGRRAFLWGGGRRRIAAEARAVVTEWYFSRLFARNGGENKKPRLVDYRVWKNCYDEPPKLLKTSFG